MLVFNNSSCIHQFKNVNAPDGTPPQALSVRIKYSVGTDHRCWNNLMFNTGAWWRFSGVAISKTLLNEPAEDRDPKYL